MNPQLVNLSVMISEYTQLIWLWINTYINTIFRGMNIRKSQLFLWLPGVQGFNPIRFP